VVEEENHLRKAGERSGPVDSTSAGDQLMKLQATRETSTAEREEGSPGILAIANGECRPAVAFADWEFLSPTIGRHLQTQKLVPSG